VHPENEVYFVCNLSLGENKWDNFLKMTSIMQIYISNLSNVQAPPHISLNPFCQFKKNYVFNFLRVGLHKTFAISKLFTKHLTISKLLSEKLLERHTVCYPMGREGFKYIVFLWLFYLQASKKNVFFL